MIKKVAPVDKETPCAVCGGSSCVHLRGEPRARVNIGSASEWRNAPISPFERGIEDSFKILSAEPTKKS